MNQMIAPPVGVQAGKKAKVFVSYSRKDIAFAQDLVAALVEHGFDAFLDKTDIAPGEPWKERLAGLIAAADTVVFAVSPDSVDSSICHWELEESARLGKRLIPIVARRIADADAPEPLARLNWIFCTDADDRSAALAALDEALNTDLSWVREHTRLGELARRWDERHRVKGTALRGADLDAAERWLDRRPADANAPTDVHQDFIRESRRAATSRQRSWVAGAIAVALVALGLAGFAEISRREAQNQRDLAEYATASALKARDEATTARLKVETRDSEIAQQKDKAEANLGAAKRAVEGLIFDVEKDLRNVSGIRTEAVITILQTVEKTVEELSHAENADADVRRLQGEMYGGFARAHLRVGDIMEAQLYAEFCIGHLSEIAAKDSSNLQLPRQIAVCQQLLGDVRLREGHTTEALSAYHQAFSTLELLTEKADNKELQGDISMSLKSIGDAKRALGDNAGAAAAYKQGRGILKKLVEDDPHNEQIQRDIVEFALAIGDMKADAGDLAGALFVYRRGFHLAYARAEAKPQDLEAQRHEVVLLGKIGWATQNSGDETGASAAFQQQFEIAERVVGMDPSNADAQADLVDALLNIGEQKQHQGDQAGALAAYLKGGEVAEKLAALKPGYVRAQSAISLGLRKVGRLKLQEGDQAGALTTFQRALDIDKSIANLSTFDSKLDHDWWIDLNNVGEAKTTGGDEAGALEAYREALRFAKHYVARNPNSVPAQWDMVVSLLKLGALAARGREAAFLLQQAQGIVAKLDREKRLSPPQKKTIQKLEASLVGRRATKH